MATAATYLLSITQAGAAIGLDVLSSAGVTINAKVKAARTCSYAYTIAGDGPVDLTSLVGATVVVTLDVGAGVETIFTGRVNRTPTYDTNTRTVAIEATDGWQAFVNGKTLAELEALISNGTYREDLDGPRVSGLQQTIALLSTTPEDAFLNRSGVFTVTHLLPNGAGSEDGTVDASTINGVTPRLADADELINTVAVTYEHTFDRRVWWRTGFTWAGVEANWCEWYTTAPSSGGAYELPTRDEILSAAAGTGWTVLGGISMGGHPENFGPGTASFPCGEGIGWILSDYFLTEATSASWDAGKTYGVEGRETLTLTVSAASSESAYGEHPGELRFVADTEYAIDAVDSDDNPTEPEGFTSYGAGGTQSYSDEMDATQRADNIAAALAKAQVQILETHCRNTVSWTQLADPRLDLGQTWVVDHPLSTCRGVVSELRHQISAQQALTQATVKAYIGGGGTDDTLTAPAFAPPEPVESAPPETIIDTRVGNALNSAPFDPAWTESSNWVTNATGWICSPPGCPDPEQIYYQIGLYVKGPDISDAARAAIEHAGAASYAVSIPPTTITVSGG